MLRRRPKRGLIFSKVRIYILSIDVIIRLKDGISVGSGKNPSAKRL